MLSTTIPYADWSASSSVFKALSLREESIREFISDFPDRAGFQGAINRRTHPAVRRKALVKVLQAQHSQTPYAAIHANIAALADEKTFTVTTGHQLTLFTGPAYFIYKIAHAIVIARELQTQFPTYRFVPVYWMASEDHDFEEVNHVNTTQGKVHWNVEAGGAVGALTTDGLESALRDFSEQLGWTEDDDRYQMLMDAVAQPNYSLAARTWVEKLFGAEGLVVLDARDRELKQLFVPWMVDEVRHQTGHHEVIAQSELLAKSNFDRPVTPREINLFYLSDGARTRVEVDNDGACFAGSQRWESRDALCKTIENDAEKFSPNVVLRPLYQEVILPNLCYIGGAGELAYWLQLKSLFEKSGVDFPLLMPRHGVTVLSKKDVDQAQAFGFFGDGLFSSLDDLIKGWITQQHDDDVFFASIQSDMQKLYRRVAERLKSIDASLEGRTMAAHARQEKELAGLEKSALKSRKMREEVVVNRIQRIHANVYPSGELQERFLNYFELDALAGGELLRYCLTNFNGFAPAMHVVAAE